MKRKLISDASACPRFFFRGDRLGGHHHYAESASPPQDILFQAPAQSIREGALFVGATNQAHRPPEFGKAPQWQGGVEGAGGAGRFFNFGGSPAEGIGTDSRRAPSGVEGLRFRPGKSIRLVRAAPPAGDAGQC